MSFGQVMISCARYLRVFRLCAGSRTFRAVKQGRFDMPVPCIGWHPSA